MSSVFHPFFLLIVHGFVVLLQNLYFDFLFRQQNHREMLEIQLVHSRNTKEGNCPVFTPTPGVEALHQYAERNRDELENLGKLFLKLRDLVGKILFKKIIFENIYILVNTGLMGDIGLTRLFIEWFV